VKCSGVKVLFKPGNKQKIKKKKLKKMIFSDHVGKNDYQTSGVMFQKRNIKTKTF